VRSTWLLRGLGLLLVEAVAEVHDEPETVGAQIGDRDGRLLAVVVQ
jgi:hypothetical protein